MRKWVVLCGVVFLIFDTYAQGFLKANGRMIINENGEHVMLRGIGLGELTPQSNKILGVQIADNGQTLRQRIEDLIGSKRTEQFFNAWLANHTRKIDVNSTAVWGFNSVRLPLSLTDILADDGNTPGHNHLLSENTFALIDNVLDWCSDNNQYLILGLNDESHPRLQDSTAGNNADGLWSETDKQKVIAFWKEIAARYASEPLVGAYDILGEPAGSRNDSLSGNCAVSQNTSLRTLMMQITAAIRQVDQKHIIIISGNCGGNNYESILPLWDKNIVLSFHKDLSYNDDSSIANMLELSSYYHVPLWMRQPCENSNVWSRDAIRLLEKNSIGWSWCPLKKIGFNAPLEVKLNKDLQKVFDYWNGQGKRPSEQEACRAFTQLAFDIKLENCTFHKDITDAMFRQVYSSEPRPFRNGSVHNQFTVNAVDYDLGGNGLAYYDIDHAHYVASTNEEGFWNRGKAYRNDGVDIKVCSSANSNEYYVSHFETGEWLRYTLYVQESGIYDLVLDVASDTNKGAVEIVINDHVMRKSIPDTGGEESWKEVDIKRVELRAGENVIKIIAKTGGFNFRDMRFTRVNKKSPFANYQLAAKKR